MSASASEETVKRVAIDYAASGNNEIVAAVPGKIIRVINLAIHSGGTVLVRFESGAGGTALTGQMAFNGVVSSLVPGESMQGHFQTVVGESLNMELSAAISVDGWLCYQEV